MQGFEPSPHESVPHDQDANPPLPLGHVHVENHNDTRNTRTSVGGGTSKVQVRKNEEERHDICVAVATIPMGHDLPSTTEKDRQRPGRNYGTKPNHTNRKQARRLNRRRSTRWFVRDIVEQKAPPKGMEHGTARRRLSSRTKPNGTPQPRPSWWKQSDMPRHERGLRGKNAIPQAMDQRKTRMVVAVIDQLETDVVAHPRASSVAPCPTSGNVAFSRQQSICTW